MAEGGSTSRPRRSSELPGRFAPGRNSVWHAGPSCHCSASRLRRSRRRPVCHRDLGLMSEGTEARSQLANWLWLSSLSRSSCKASRAWSNSLDLDSLSLCIYLVCTEHRSSHMASAAIRDKNEVTSSRLPGAGSKGTSPVAASSRSVSRSISLDSNKQVQLVLVMLAHDGLQEALYLPPETPNSLSLSRSICHFFIQAACATKTSHDCAK